MPEARRETQLHLLFLRGDQAALCALTTDKTSYFGANVAEAAASAGVRARPLRRIVFRYEGEVDGVHRSESVWHMDHVDDVGLHWQPVAQLGGVYAGYMRTYTTQLRVVAQTQGVDLVTGTRR